MKLDVRFVSDMRKKIKEAVRILHSNTARLLIIDGDMLSPNSSARQKPLFEYLMFVVG